MPAEVCSGVLHRLVIPISQGECVSENDLDRRHRIGTAKAEALRRIQDLPWYAVEKEEWHRDVERISPTGVDAAEELAAIAARVKRSRTACDAKAVETAPVRFGRLEAVWGLGRPVSASPVLTPAPIDEAQQARVTVALLLIEIQLDKLIELSRECQSA
jgi:hypothetical protein